MLRPRHRKTRFLGLVSCLVLPAVLAFGSLVPAGTLEYPGAPLRRTFDGVFSSLYPDAASCNQVTIRGGSIPGRVCGGIEKGSGSVTGNTVFIMGGSIVRGAVGGFNTPSSVAVQQDNEDKAGSAGANSVVVLDGTVSGAIGGWANGPTYGNVVTIANGTLTGTVAGGLSVGAVSNNIVIISGGSIPTVAMGGQSEKDRAFGNHLNFTGTAVADAIVGGDGQAGAIENSVFLLGGEVKTTVTGGLSAGGIAYGNRVVAQGGAIDGLVTGGHASDQAATDNTVLIGSRGFRGSLTCGGGAVGGVSDEGLSTQNRVEILSGMVRDSVSGGMGRKASMNNAVIVFGGGVTSAILGGESMIEASRNSVGVHGGFVADVTGGFVTDGKQFLVHLRKILAKAGSESGKSAPFRQLANANKVLVDGGTVYGSITGGWAEKGSATNNTVTIAGSAILSDDTALCGGKGAEDCFTGNTLNLDGTFLAGSVSGFQNFEFRSPPLDDLAALHLSGKAILGRKGQETRVRIVLSDEKRSLPERIVLIHADGGVNLAGGVLKAHQEGLKHKGRLFDVAFSVEKNDLVARFIERKDKDAHAQKKSPLGKE